MGEGTSRNAEFAERSWGDSQWCAAACCWQPGWYTRWRIASNSEYDHGAKNLDEEGC